MWVSRRALTVWVTLIASRVAAAASTATAFSTFAIGALSAHPRVLHHVVGVCRTFDDAIAGTEEAREDGLKQRGVRVGVLACALMGARCDSTATSCRSM